MKAKYNLLFFVIYLLVSGSSNSLAQLRSTYTFPKLDSHISIPISIPISEIHSLINNSVHGVLYQDDSYTDNNNDQFKVKVTKDGEIEIKPLKGNRLLISIPLNIWTEQGYGGLGYYVYQDVTFGVVMQFITSLDFKSNWVMETQTKAHGFEWTTKPVLDFGKVKIPIASIVESRLTEQQQKFTGIIDQQIKESLDLKPYLLSVWNYFNTPIEIAPDYQTWLKLTPESIYMTPLTVYSNYIKASVGLDLYSETFVGRIPLPSPMSMTIPNFRLKESLPTEFEINTTVNIPFAQATEVARKQFKGKTFPINDKNEVLVTDIRVFPDKQSIVIEIDTEGKIKGTSTIKGFPYYDAVQNKIALTDIEFKLKTGNILQKTLVFLFEKKIRKMIETEYGIPLGEIEAASKQSLNESFNQEYYKGIFLSGKVLNLKPTQVFLFDDYMLVLVKTKGQLQLKVNGLSF